MNKNIVLLSLGGTIAMRVGETGAADVGLTAGDLVADGAFGPGINVDAATFMNVPGVYLALADIERLASTIRAKAEEGAAGVVVTQGTDTIEEVAFVLDQLLDLQIPVVVTGAMRNASIPGADGPANVIAAVRAAACSTLADAGVVVVMNDEIHAARFVQKRHTSSPSAFSSTPAGPIGWIAEGNVSVALKPVSRSMGLLSEAIEAPDASVALVKLGLDTDVSQVEAVASTACAGLVVEAFGGGHMRPDAADVLEALARKIPVLLSSRTGAGPVLNSTYGFAGGEIDLHARGLISTGYLDALKSRLLLMLMLRRGYARDRIRKAFAGFGAAA